jgi:hypothetical protein
MAIDPALEAALQTAVEELGQPRPVAQRLVAWLRSLSEGEVSEDRDLQFYESILQELKIDGLQDAD